MAEERSMELRVDPDHARTVAAYDWIEDKKCVLSGGIGEYPYECKRKDREPEALVVRCQTHSTWWVQS